MHFTRQTFCCISLLRSGAVDCYYNSFLLYTGQKKKTSIEHDRIVLLSLQKSSIAFMMKENAKQQRNARLTYPATEYQVVWILPTKMIAVGLFVSVS